MSATRTLETDVVVIGGGSAGCYAALKVQSEGLRVLQIVKGFVGRSGASIFAGNLQLQKTKDAAEEEKFINVRARYGSSYLNDQDYIRRACRFTEEVFCKRPSWLVAVPPLAARTVTITAEFLRRRDGRSRRSKL